MLDEPTNGLDPQGTREVRALVGSLADDGTTVLVSSHLLSEVEQMCTHVGVMHVGRLVAQGTVAEVRAGTATRGDRRDRPAPGGGPDHARAGAARGRATTHAAATGLLGERGAGEDRGGLRAPRACRCVGFAVDTPSLEDMFVSLTGEGFDVSG